jgi:hypothetical protein
MKSLGDLLEGHDFPRDVRTTLSAWREAAEDIAKAARAIRGAADAARSYYATKQYKL